MYFGRRERTRECEYHLSGVMDIATVSAEDAKLRPTLSCISEARTKLKPTLIFFRFKTT